MNWFLCLMMFCVPSALHARALKQSVRRIGQPITIIEPHLNAKVTYVGRPFNDVLDELFGVKWRKQEEVLLTCADGYQSSIAAEKFLSHKAWLVWERGDQGAFELKNKLQGGEIVPLGPYYLVWDNQDDAGILSEGATDFPYQITSVDLISFRERFPKLAPSKDAKIEVRNGFKLYRTYCMSCHALDGEGGEEAPDLRDVGLFTRLKENDLKAWILNPSALKPGTLMPAFAPQSVDRDAKADKMISYLKSKIMK